MARSAVSRRALPGRLHTLITAVIKYPPSGQQQQRHADMMAGGGKTKNETTTCLSALSLARRTFKGNPIYP